MLMNECQFDYETVKSFCKSGDKSHFSVFLKTNRERAETYYDKRFVTRTDKTKMELLEKELDPGF